MKNNIIQTFLDTPEEFGAFSLPYKLNPTFEEAIGYDPSKLRSLTLNVRAHYEIKFKNDDWSGINKYYTYDQLMLIIKTLIDSEYLAENIGLVNVIIGDKVDEDSTAIIKPQLGINAQSKYVLANFIPEMWTAKNSNGISSLERFLKWENFQKLFFENFRIKYPKLIKKFQLNPQDRISERIVNDLKKTVRLNPIDDISIDVAKNIFLWVKSYFNNDNRILIFDFSLGYLYKAIGALMSFSYSSFANSQILYSGIYSKVPESKMLRLTEFLADYLGLFSNYNFHSSPCKISNIVSDPVFSKHSKKYHLCISAIDAINTLDINEIVSHSKYLLKSKGFLALIVDPKINEIELFQKLSSSGFRLVKKNYIIGNMRKGPKINREQLITKKSIIINKEFLNYKLLHILQMW
jgi:hypothetical protein